MKTWVRLVLKLLRNKTTLDFSRQLVSPSNCSGHARILRNIFDLSAERLHQLHFLHGISMRVLHKPGQGVLVRTVINGGEECYRPDRECFQRRRVSSRGADVSKSNQS